ncbi:hypothetical protein [Aquimonas sp.]|jgi:hypothetical protein|uniref:hypothetical protein n=1 Tax=Aquimonas sp. TaxID=1872588 RepID=UPI0037C0A9DA
MSTEAALFTANDTDRTKYIAVPERAVRHLVGHPNPWRLCSDEAPSMPADIADRVVSWVNPELRRIAIAPATKVGLLQSNDDSFASVFGLDGLEGDRPGSVGRVVLDASLLESLPDRWRPQFLRALNSGGDHHDND